MRLVYHCAKLAPAGLQNTMYWLHSRNGGEIIKELGNHLARGRCSSQQGKTRHNACEAQLRNRLVGARKTREALWMPKRAIPQCHVVSNQSWYIFRRQPQGRSIPYGERRAAGDALWQASCQGSHGIRGLLVVELVQGAQGLPSQLHITHGVVALHGLVKVGVEGHLSSTDSKQLRLCFAGIRAHP